MALTPEKSAQYTDFTAIPGVSVHGAEWDGKIRTAVGKMTYTAAGQGQAKMLRLPAGRKLIFPDLCRIVSPAAAAGSTIDVGHGAYTKPDGTAVAADIDAFLDGEVNTAAVDKAFVLPAAPYFVLDSKDGVDITMDVAVADSPSTGDAYVVVVYAMAR